MFLRVIITEVVEDPDILSSSQSYTPLLLPKSILIMNLVFVTLKCNSINLLIIYIGFWSLLVNTQYCTFQIYWYWYE